VDGNDGKKNAWETNLYLLNLEIKTGHVVSQLLYYDLDPKMTKFEILFFMKVVDSCCSVPNKQTTNKTKLYRSSYTQNNKQCLDSNSWTITI
jgi:hypothetical protein